MTPTELQKLWQADPADWDPWLVFADRLVQCGDARGELLSIEHELEGDPDVGLFLQEWLDRELLPDSDAEQLEWAHGLKRKLAPLQHRAPVSLRRALARPLSQVLALASLHPAADDPYWIAVHHRALIEGLQAWIEEAFDGVPAPGEGHPTLRQAEAADNYDYACDRSGDPIGRWQDLTDDYLLSCQWSLSHLDAVGLQHYLPAVMCFDLRHRLELHPEDHWLTESLEYHLEPNRGQLAGYQRERFAFFTEAQRWAIAAYRCSFHGDGCHEDWVRTVLEPGADWISTFQQP